MNYNNLYELLLILRENKVLFNYLDQASIEIDEGKDFRIIAKGREGYTYINLLSNSILRISLPLLIIKETSSDLVWTLIENHKTDIEGLIHISCDEEGRECLYYYLHTDMYTTSNLNKALHKFVTERNIVVNTINKLVESIKTSMNKNLEGNVQTESAPSSESKNSTWGSLKEIDMRNLDIDESEIEEDDMDELDELDELD